MIEVDLEGTLKFFNMKTVIKVIVIFLGMGDNLQVEILFLVLLSMKQTFVMRNQPLYLVLMDSLFHPTEMIPMDIFSMTVNL